MTVDYRQAAIDAYQSAEDYDGTYSEVRMIKLARAQFFALMANLSATEKLLDRIDKLSVGN